MADSWNTALLQDESKSLSDQLKEHLLTGIIFVFNLGLEGNHITKKSGGKLEVKLEVFL